MGKFQVSKLDMEKDIDMIALALIEKDHPYRNLIINKLACSACSTYNKSLEYLNNINLYLKEKYSKEFSNEDWFMFGYIFTKQR